LKVGLVVNPVNAMLTPAEVSYVTKDRGAKALIGSADRVAAALESGLTGLKAIVFGNSPVAGAKPFNELIASSNKSSPHELLQRQNLVSATRLAYWQPRSADRTSAAFVGAGLRSCPCSRTRDSTDGSLHCSQRVP
jgi:acyl-CoA synthetase (AMP-forming)/AMP-acid ligase II